MYIALHRPVASPVKEAGRNAMDASKIVGATRLEETLEK